jgi:membrane protein implicated in regulation of membrane protease activity
MEGHKEIRPTRVFVMVIMDISLLVIFVAAFLPSHMKIMAATYLPIVLVSNVVFLRHSRKTEGTPGISANTMVRSGKSPLYICSGMFFIGAFGGLLTIIQGELPRTLLPLLLVPLLVAVYCWRMARRIATHASNPHNA